LVVGWLVCVVAGAVAGSSAAFGAEPGRVTT
jgi:hypothetical protein